MMQCLVSKSVAFAVSLHRTHFCTVAPLPDAAVAPLSAEGSGYLASDQIQAVADTWERLAPADNLYLSVPFLQSMEDFPPAGMRFRYLVFFRHGQPAGIALAQIVPIRTTEHLQWLNDGHWLRKQISGLFNFTMLICGTVQGTGKHGFHFRDDFAQNGQLLVEALEKEATRLNAGAIMIKDTCRETATDFSRIRQSGYTAFPFQPNMVLSRAPHWRQLSDYLEDLSAKYRVRYRRARKKLGGLTRKELSYPDIRTYNDTLHTLYQDQAAKADFNLISLHPGYWQALKAALGNRFRVWAYFSGGEMVGFYTGIYHGESMEAHFLGYDETVNREHQLYLNMLFDLTEEAINAGAERLVFARTALEIKSSVGAKPEMLNCYVRHKNPVVNLLLPNLVRYLEPEAEWTPRHPFTESDASTSLSTGPDLAGGYVG
ncbi:MAG TPA: GNAT family N-acetyltransferase [Flavilitoribacter sp.]|nr:GNAT family N-acetyltransferase [Flavilitoribacter sp.]HMQ89084.1 GNAT family N-acetyltransferase [Flavilitoribacter sp.]